VRGHTSSGRIGGMFCGRVSGKRRNERTKAQSAAKYHKDQTGRMHKTSVVELKEHYNVEILLG